MTNALTAEILQWAYDNSKINEADNIEFNVDSVIVNYAGRPLLQPVDPITDRCRIDYNAGTFTVENGYDTYPLQDVSWFGAIMLCNWLTERENGSMDQVVYSGIPDDGTTWGYYDTIADASAAGYRLPSIEEWEYAARYLGTTAPSGGTALEGERVFQDENYTGTEPLTAGYYWTPGDYASGAAADVTDVTATDAVAVYNLPWDTEDVGETAAKLPNYLGLYDMSGNAFEWCFTNSGSSRTAGGGMWTGTGDMMRVGDTSAYGPENLHYFMGFRLCKTAE